MKDRVLESFVRHGVRLAVLFVLLASMAGLDCAQSVGAAAQPSPKAAAPAASARKTSAAPLAISPAARTRAMQTYSGLPMSFEVNAGQTDPRVKFLAHAPGYSLFLTNEEAVLSLSEPSPARKPIRTGDPSDVRNAPQPPRVSHAVQVKFLRGSEAAVVAGSHELPSKSNYFIGNDPKNWHTNVPNYSAVKYNGIYPGVDAVFHGDNQRFEFDFDIAPGADPRSIALEVDGARKMRLNRAGDLVLAVDATHELIMNKPRTYQQSPEGRREVAGRYVLAAGNRIAFKIGPYDHSRPLVIDPTLVYSTYLGGSLVNSASNQYPNDLGKAIAVDSDGDVYVAGPAGSVDFPVTTGAYDTIFNAGQYTAFVSKLSPSGSSLIYSTFLGSTYPNVSTVEGIALDSSGDAYLTGYTNYGYPTTAGAFISAESSLYGTYAFVTELNPTGTSLVYSTYLSGTEATGSPETYGFAIAADATGNAYVVGTTDSQTYPTTTGAYQTSANCTSPYQGTCTTAFVTKIAVGGSSLSYSTYLGTGGNRANAVAIDSSGDAFVVGNTEPTTFPVTSGAFMTSSSSAESLAFVTELNPSGTALVYSTFLAGSNSNTTYLDDAYAVAVDGSGYAYVTGTASDSDFPTTPGAYQKSLVDYSDAFVTKLNLTGSALVYSTYLPGLTTGYGIGVNSSGEAFVAGDNDGNGNDFPTTSDALQTTPPTTGTNGFLTEFNATGSGLVYSTYLGPTSLTSGNNEATVAWALAMDGQGSAYVTGSAPSGFPTTSGAYKTALSAGNNAFIMKFASTPEPSVSPSPTSLTFTPENVGTPSAPQTLTITNTGTANLSITTALIGGTNPGDFATSADTCTGATLIPAPSDASTCTINVTFTPIATGSRSATLIFSDNAPDTPQSVGLTGTGAGGAPLTISPATIPYAFVGESYFESFTATGGSGTGYTWSVTSGTALSAVGLSLTSAGVISGVPNSTETAAPFTVKVVDSQDNSATQNYSLTVYPDISATPTTLPAGTMGTPYSQTLTASGGSGGPYSFSVASGTALSAVGLTLSSTGTISGTPNATENAAAVTLRVADSLGDFTQLNYSLTINVPLAPIASLSTPLLTFGPQAAGTPSAAQTVTLTNTGNAPLNFTGSGISISGANAADFAQTNQCGTSVAAGGNCPINVTFTPSSSSSAPSGIVAAELNVADNASGTPQQVALAGIALPSTSVSCNIPNISWSLPQTDQITCSEDLTNPSPLGPYTLVCNLPAPLSTFATCSFSPNSMSFASTTTPPYTASTALTIQSAAGASLERRPLPGRASPGAVAFGAVLWLPACIFVLRRKKGSSKRGILFLLILLCGLPLMTSCVGKSGPTTPPAGTYQASVVLNGPGLNETINFTIQVP